jgi:hypothetical protein
MRARFASFFLLLIMTGQNLAGGFPHMSRNGSGCADADPSAVGACTMACCEQAKLPSASPASKICCETLCGKPTGESSGIIQPESARQVPAPSVACSDLLLLKRALEGVVSTSGKSSDRSLLHCDRPALYLHNSAFLI